MKRKSSEDGQPIEAVITAARAAWERQWAEDAAEIEGEIDALSLAFERLGDLSARCEAQKEASGVALQEVRAQADRVARISAAGDCPIAAEIASLLKAAPAKRLAAIARGAELSSACLGALRAAVRYARPRASGKKKQALEKVA